MGVLALLSRCRVLLCVLHLLNCAPRCEAPYQDHASELFVLLMSVTVADMLT